jgi:probable rRNA maturation factor
MRIITDEEITIKETLMDYMKRAGDMCISGEGLEPELCEVSLSVVEPEEIKSINARFRDNDSVTDVLSFPQFDDLNDIENDEEICLGDVVICDQVAHSQAEEYGHTYEREFVYLFVHSMLHLLGYDHMEEEEKAEMRKREEEVMSAVELCRE